MSTTPPVPPPAPTFAGVPSALRGWVRFWFTPGDPTTLGFLRLVVGFIVLYVHLAYSFDLHAFFGPHGWWGLATVDRERRDMPTYVPPFWDQENGGWNEGTRTAYLPAYPHRKAAFLAFLNSLPTDDPAKLKTALRYLVRLQEFSEPPANNPLQARDGLLLLQALPTEPDLRARELANMVKGDDRFVGRVSGKLPAFILALPPDSPTNHERKDLADEIEAFYRALPADADDRQFVVAHFVETDPGIRRNIIKFIQDLATVSADERAARIEYLSYWNFEKRYAHRLGKPLFSVWFHVTDPTAMAAIHAGILVVIFLFAVGFCTRVTSVLTWLAVVGYIHRTDYVLFGMDTMMNILLIYLMIGNSGAALSVDRLIARYRASRNSLAKHGHLDDRTKAFLAAPPPSPSAAFALKMLNVHFCFIYMAAGLSKLKGSTWWNTTAYWDTLVNPEFTLVHYRWYEWVVREAAANRPLFALAAAVGVGLTFVAEISLPYLIWTRMRPYMMIFGFLLHAGVAVFMGLVIFSLLMMMMLVGYMPGWCIRERIFGANPTGPRIGFEFAKSDPAQVRAAARVAALDFDGQVGFADGPVVRVLADGPPATGPDAARAVVGGLNWAGPLGWALLIPGVAGLFAPAAAEKPVAAAAK